MKKKKTVHKANPPKQKNVATRGNKNDEPKKELITENNPLPPTPAQHTEIQKVVNAQEQDQVVNDIQESEEMVES